MSNKDIYQILKKFADGEAIIGASLLRIDGKVIAAYYIGIEDTVPNLIARDSLSAKRKRRIIFPILGRLITSIAIYEKSCIGLSSVNRDQYIQLVAKSDLPLSTFCKKLEQISVELRQVKEN